MAPAKSDVIAECARVVKPGGIIAFTDVILRTPITPEADSRVVISNVVSIPMVQTLSALIHISAPHG
jgi:ubiquinone/menaquinone biosynthesis C-methylase UbiE